MGLFRVLAIACFVIATPVALVTTNIRLALSEQAVYDYSVKQYHAADVAGIPEQELIRANGRIRDYLTDEHPGELSIRVQDENKRLVPLFNEREISHMADVRDLVRLMFLANVAAIATALGAAVVLIAVASARSLAVAAMSAAFVTIGSLTAVGITALTGFDSAWTQFHELAFTNDFWELDPDRDHLIQMFPEEFWRDIVALTAVVTFVQAAALAAGGALYLRISSEDGARRIGSPVPALPDPAPADRIQPTHANPGHSFH